LYDFPGSITRQTKNPEHFVGVGRVMPSRRQHRQIQRLAMNEEPARSHSPEAARHLAPLADRERQLLQAVQRDRFDFGALHSLGVLHLDAHRFAAAAAVLKTALAVNPHSGDAHADLGIALASLDRPLEALVSFDRAIALLPDAARVHSNRANLLVLLERFEAALASADRAIALEPGFAAAHNNRGNALLRLERYAEALGSLDIAIALDPGFADAHFNRGVALAALGQTETARQSYDRALACAPGHARALWNRAICLLLQGDYRTGFRDYEYRQNLNAIRARRRYPQPLWLGAESLTGKTLFVYHEMALGDMLQFCRYLPLAEAAGAHVVLSAQNSLHAILAGLGTAITIVPENAAPLAFDLHLPLLSLPRAFGTTLATVPAPERYLAAQPARVARWRAWLGETGFRIGVCWHASRRHQGQDRSFDPAALAPLAALPGVRLISLQKSDPGEAAPVLPPGMRLEVPGADFDAGPQAFLDTAALLESLDLVVTCDTSVAHLAGALGRPTWVVLKAVPDWRWGLRDTTTPWYPSLRLFRQRVIGDWRAPFAELEQALADRLNGKAA
jgi:tetratricopeptide (TPR) repeat protein